MAYTNIEHNNSLKFDQKIETPTMELGEFLINNPHLYSKQSEHEMNKIMTSIKLAAKIVDRELRKAGLGNILGEHGAQNVQGENQQKLDVLANEVFVKALVNRRVVCGICSEEEENFIPVNNESSLIVLMDPLDGSSNIDVNVSVGTIFSIYHRLSPIGTPPQIDDFLQCGNQQIVAGYVLYGSSTMLVCAFDDAVHGFTLDHSLGTFYLSHPNIKFPNQVSAYSINEGNYKSFPKGVQEFINSCQENHKCNLLYIGSLVSDFHRNLMQGGVYLYPSTKKDKNGKLRLLYECNPMAYISEKAGGSATDGYHSILSIKPKELHQRIPCIFGNKALVDEFGILMETHNPK